MKRLKGYIPALILVSILVAGIFNSFQAKAFMGDKAIRACVCCENGVTVALANDCLNGNGTCIDNPCPEGEKECGQPCS
jgi:hypothetical protein